MAHTVSTGQLIDDVAQWAGISRADAKKAVQAVVEALGARLSAGERVQLSGLGSFEVRDRAARTATNPRTKAKIAVPASKAVGFRPATGLRARLGGGADETSSLG